MDVLVCQGLPWRNGPILAANDCLQELGIKGMKHYYLFISLQPSFVELTYQKKGTVTWIPIVLGILSIQAECSSPPGTM